MLQGFILFYLHLHTCVDKQFKQNNRLIALILHNTCYVLEMPAQKPPPLKYHLFTQKLPKNDDGDISDAEDENLDAAMETKEPYHHHGIIVFTTECKVIAPGSVIPGTLAITSDSLYFTADEESEEIKTIDPQVIL